jgi:hypothetical protein
MRRDRGHVLAILITALTQYVEKENAPLPRIDQVLDQRRENVERGGRREGLRGRHLAAPFFVAADAIARASTLMVPPRGRGRDRS